MPSYPVNTDRDSDMDHLVDPSHPQARDLFKKGRPVGGATPAFPERFLRENPDLADDIVIRDVWVSKCQYWIAISRRAQPDLPPIEELIA